MVSPEQARAQIDAEVEQRKVDRRLRDVHLEEIGFSAVFESDGGGGPFGGLFARQEFVSCQLCGAVVRLNDTMDSPLSDDDKTPVERNIWAHWNFHARIGDRMPNPENKET